MVERDALVAELVRGRLRAGLDVFWDEPHVPAELLELPNVVLTPHIGSATEAARQAMTRLVVDNVLAVLAGREPRRRCSRSRRTRRGSVWIVRSDAHTVEDYIAGAPTERRAALSLLRGLCLEGLVGYQEVMRYGMPGYTRADVVEIGFASQKAYLSLYVARQAALAAGAGRLDGLSVGKGCIRFRRPDQIDPDVVRALLSATVLDDGPVC